MIVGLGHGRLRRLRGSRDQRSECESRLGEAIPGAALVREIARHALARRLLASGTRPQRVDLDLRAAVGCAHCRDVRSRAPQRDTLGRRRRDQHETETDEEPLKAWTFEAAHGAHDATRYTVSPIPNPSRPSQRGTLRMFDVRQMATTFALTAALGVPLAAQEA